MSYTGGSLKRTRFQDEQSDQITYSARAVDHDYPLVGGQSCSNNATYETTNSLVENEVHTLEFLSVADYEEPEDEDSSFLSAIQTWSTYHNIGKIAMIDLLKILNNMFPPNSDVELVTAEERLYKKELMELMLSKLKEKEQFVLNLNSKIDKLQKDINDLNEDLKARHISYKKDLQLLKKASNVKPISGIADLFPVKNADAFTTMENRLVKDEEFKTDLIEYFNTMHLKRLHNLFEERVINKYSLSGKAPLLSIRNSHLITLIAQSWAKVLNRPLELVFLDMDKDLVKSRHRASARTAKRIKSAKTNLDEHK